MVAVRKAGKGLVLLRGRCSGPGVSGPLGTIGGIADYTRGKVGMALVGLRGRAMASARAVMFVMVATVMALLVAEGRASISCLLG